MRDFINVYKHVLESSMEDRDRIFPGALVTGEEAVGTN